MYIEGVLVGDLIDRLVLPRLDFSGVEHGGEGGGCVAAAVLLLPAYAAPHLMLRNPLL